MPFIELYYYKKFFLSTIFYKPRVASKIKHSRWRRLIAMNAKIGEMSSIPIGGINFLKGSKM